MTQVSRACAILCGDFRLSKPRRLRAILVSACALAVLLVGADTAAPGGGGAFGRLVPGTEWFAIGGASKRSSRFTLANAGTVTSVSAYLDGLGGASGAQQVRFAVYADKYGAPAGLVAESTVGTLEAGDPASWFELPLESPVALPAGSYHLAILAGATGRVVRYSRAPLPGGMETASDAFADGASDPYGPTTSYHYEAAIHASLAAAVAAPVNLVLPALEGTPQVGQHLNASEGTWSNSPTSYGYQWRRCDSLGQNCVDIAGASGNWYAVATADQGGTLRVRVTATNAGGSASAVSAPTDRVTAAGRTFGRLVLGTEWFAMGGDSKRSSRFTLAEAGTVTSVSAYLDGWGGASGAQQLRFAVYSDKHGGPAGLLAESTVGTVEAGNPASWFELPLESPVALPAGSYHLAILAGATGRVVRYSRAPLPGGMETASDVFGDGASDPYGPSTSYDYVAAIHASLGGAAASPIPAPTPADTTAPSAPTGLLAPSKTSSSVTLAWTASVDDVGVAGYRVYREGTAVGTTSTTAYTAGGLACDVSYAFAVEAFDAAGNVSPRASLAAKTAACAGLNVGLKTLDSTNADPVGLSDDSNACVLTRSALGDTFALLLASTRCTWTNTSFSQMGRHEVFDIDLRFDVRLTEGTAWEQEIMLRPYGSGFDNGNCSSGGNAETMLLRLWVDNDPSPDRWMLDIRGGESINLSDQVVTQLDLGPVVVGQTLKLSFDIVARHVHGAASVWKNGVLVYQDRDRPLGFHYDCDRRTDISEYALRMQQGVYRGGLGIATLTSSGFRFRVSEP
jgi:hypothetical protein